jgi:hypothetical protein
VVLTQQQLKHRHDEHVEFEIAVQGVTLASSLRMTVCRDMLKNGAHSHVHSLAQSGGAAQSRNEGGKQQNWLVYRDTVTLIGRLPSSSGTPGLI